MTLRIAFLGTGRLAQPVFEALCNSPHAIVGLVTQPDRTGRGHHRHVNPLKEFAIARGIPVFQPETLKTPEYQDALRDWQADLFVVAAYGQILPKIVLNLPRLGCINVHASLLPKYRGATPIHAAILNGDAESGVTIIRLVSQLDAGPMLGVVRTPIDPRETTGELEIRLADLAVPLTLQVVSELEAGSEHEEIQDDAAVSHVGKLTKQDGMIPWEKTADQVSNHIRGMQPWPGPYSVLHSDHRPPVRMQVLEVSPESSESQLSPGSVVEISASGMRVQCGTGALRILKVQPEGKRPMATADFLRGHPIKVGDRFVSANGATAGNSAGSSFPGKLEAGTLDRPTSG